jgi:hypothetical protein
MDQNEKGAKTYNRILQSCRINNRPLGSEHHLFDRQHKEWQEKNKGSKQNNGKVRVKKIKAINISRSPKNSESDNEKLFEKYRLYMKKKLADTLKCDLRLSHIKSVGNGL